MEGLEKAVKTNYPVDSSLGRGRGATIGRNDESVQTKRTDFLAMSYDCAPFSFR